MFDPNDFAPSQTTYTTTADSLPVLVESRRQITIEHEPVETEAATYPAPSAIDFGPRGVREALHSSASNEWYTPPEIVDRVRTVLGVIDLDPFSCDAANQIVRAATYFDGVRGDGFENPYLQTNSNPSRVFVNPPYGQLTGKAVTKLVRELDAGHVSAAILLVNNATHRSWFRPIWERASMICFPYKPIKFWRAAILEGENVDDYETRVTAGDTDFVVGKQPTNGNVIALFTADDHERAPRLRHFRAQFETIGKVVEL